MAVLLVATFPILLLIDGPVALLGLTVGIWLLYRDYRDQSLVQPRKSARPVQPPRVAVPRRRPRVRQGLAA